MRKSFLRYWAGAGVLLVLTTSTSHAQSDEEILNVALNASRES
jgi:hypothetical protein